MAKQTVRLASMTAMERIEAVAEGKASVEDLVSDVLARHGARGLQLHLHVGGLYPGGVVPEGQRAAAEAVAAACMRRLQGLPVTAFGRRRAVE